MSGRASMNSRISLKSIEVSISHVWVVTFGIAYVFWIRDGVTTY